MPLRTRVVFLWGPNALDFLSPPKSLCNFPSSVFQLCKLAGIYFPKKGPLDKALSLLELGREVAGERGTISSPSVPSALTLERLGNSALDGFFIIYFACLLAIFIVEQDFHDMEISD